MVISLLTAWTVLILFFAFTSVNDAVGGNEASLKFFRIAFLYSGFAFLLSLIREAIKDMEDLPGDLKYGCRTLPIVAGTRATKLYTGILYAILILSLLVLELYLIQLRWWWASLYLPLFIIIPLLYSTLRLRKASSTEDFARLSRSAKWIMLTGILSMIFFQIYLSDEPFDPGIPVAPPKSIIAMG
jgi:4-hydroxybenzoate polyprenyltransferase